MCGVSIFSCNRRKNYMPDLIRRLLETSDPDADLTESDILTVSEVSFFRGIGILGDDS
jgi:hypothetical protein